MTKKVKSDNDVSLRRQAEKYARMHTDVLQAYIDGYNAGAKATKCRPAEPDLSFVAPAFTDIFRQWLDYKVSKGQAYKNERSLRAIYNRLMRLSSGVVEIASAIVENCVAREWDGLFPLDDRECQAIMRTITERKIKEAEITARKKEAEAQNMEQKRTTPQDLVRRLEERVRLGDEEAAAQLALAKKTFRKGIVYATDL